MTTFVELFKTAGADLALLYDRSCKQQVATFFEFLNVCVYCDMSCLFLAGYYYLIKIEYFIAMHMSYDMQTIVNILCSMTTLP